MTKVNGRRSRRHICNKHNTRTHARTYLHAWSGVWRRTFFFPVLAVAWGLRAGRQD